ncbi:putative cell cycle protein [Bdellovibrio bacteriovorus W]|nr:putative cell cycle protein [Bdellovibrio bacteriovorus W]
MSSKILLHALDHDVLKILKDEGLLDRRILVGLSGGVDSVALLRVLSKFLPKENLKAFYFHHGEHENSVYRDEALLFCEKLCADLNVEFSFEKNEEVGTSENFYRELRYQAFYEHMAIHGYDVLALGHHRDDLLETRLLRLLRGTGGQGLVAMRPLREDIFRPFLGKSKKDLGDYLLLEKLPVIQDPSNDSLDPLRNWLREYWLPQLEERSEGSVESLSRSLETIASELDRHGSAWDLLDENEAYKSHGLSRIYYLSLSRFEQRRLLAQYLNSLKIKGFSQSHLEEIQKRLDNSQKVITFRVGGCNWEVNAEQIRVQTSISQ